jgi:acyl-CoA hydrolase
MNEPLRPGRPVRDSIADYSEIALPIYANPLGNLLGGRIMHLVDIAAAIAAMRHARTPVVTASIDQMSFLHPVHIGQLVVLKASVNRVFRTSMEVGVKVWSEDLTTGERKHTSSAYTTFVALDREGQRVAPPPVIPESEIEKLRYEEAGERRAYRLEMRERQRVWERE